nr:PREDICTED: BOLA class I histocompatibility antigen, alpha chain BL3-6-like [Paralichthys olivaceus]
MKNTMKNKVDTCPVFFLVSVLGLLSMFPVLSAERHSLTYIYTAFSKPVQSPGLHEFTAMGMVDQKMIDYFDSDLNLKVPKETWMEQNMGKDYWKMGTESRQSKQKWFNVNIDILMKRLRQNDTDTHVLQWLHGCESITVDGSMKFYRGVDTYSYDGNDFLHFDDGHGVWVSSGAAADDTKRKWDGVQTLKDYTKGYLENECLKWLEKFVTYRQKQLQAAPSPSMFMFAKKSHTETSVILTCLATGFLQRQVELEMRRDGRLLTAQDGVRTSNVRPNDDNTYQIRNSVEILKTDMSLFTCEVLHRESSLSVATTWDRKLPNAASGLTYVGVGVGLVVLVVLGVAAALIVLHKKGRLCVKKERTIETTGNSQPIPNGSIPQAAEVPLLNTENGENRSQGGGSDSGVSTDSHGAKQSKEPSPSEQRRDGGGGASQAFDKLSKTKAVKTAEIK